MAKAPFTMASPELEELEVGITDPSFSAMQGTEGASKEEEAALGEAMVKIMEFAYSEEGMASIVQVLNQDNRELYESVPELSKPLIEKALGGIDESMHAAVVFGEGGLLQQVPPMIFEIAEQIGLPSATDPDQLSGAMINLYRLAGEHILKKGDKSAVTEAQALGEEVVLTKEDGSVEDRETFSKRANKAVKGNAKRNLSDDIQQGLLGL